MAERLVAAYFQPQNIYNDKNRLIRGQKYGLSIPDETRGCGRVLDPEGKIRQWSDLDPETVGLEMRDAKEHGIDAFLVTVYPGQSGGQDATEFKEVADIVVDQAKKNDMKFAFMFSIRRAPNQIPYPINAVSPEPGRYFDLTPGTLDTMMDFAEDYFRNDHYLRLYKNRPLVMIYGLTPQIIHQFQNQLPEENRVEKIGYHMLYHNVRAHKVLTENYQQIVPFFTAVVDSPDMAHTMLDQGFDATTSYAGLPTFYEEVLQSDLGAGIDPRLLPPIQEYNLQLLLQARYALTHLLNGGQRYYFPAVAGWNPINRCEDKMRSEYPPRYPYAPHIVDSTPKKFLQMMFVMYLYYASMLGNETDEFPYIICSFNDVGDGDDILRRIWGDNKVVDDEYLRMVKLFSDFVHSPYPLLFIKQLVKQGLVRPELASRTEGVLAKQYIQITSSNTIPKG